MNKARRNTPPYCSLEAQTSAYSAGSSLMANAGGNLDTIVK